MIKDTANAKASDGAQPRMVRTRTRTPRSWYRTWTRNQTFFLIMWVHVAQYELILKQDAAYGSQSFIAPPGPKLAHEDNKK